MEKWKDGKTNPKKRGRAANARPLFYELKFMGSSLQVSPTLFIYCIFFLQKKCHILKKGSLNASDG